MYSRALSSLSEFAETGEVNRVNRYPLPRWVVGRVVFAGGTPGIAGAVLVVVLMAWTMPGTFSQLLQGILEYSWLAGLRLTRLRDRFPDRFPVQSITL